jgi:hypothetical protein
MISSTRRKTSLNPAVPLLFAIFILWGFGFGTVVNRLNTQLEGVIVASRDIPATGAPRYETEYVLHAQDGSETNYVAGPTDASLPRSMPVGTSVKKHRWRLDYERDGQRVDDFGIAFYAMILSIAVGCLVWSFVLFRDRKRSRLALTSR